MLTTFDPTQLLWVNPNPQNYLIIKITKMPLKWKWPKYSKIFKNDQNTPKSKNDQNTLKTQKMTKIPLKPKKLPIHLLNPKIYQNIPETKKMTKIPPKPKKWPIHLLKPRNLPKYPWNPKNDQNTPEPKKWKWNPLFLTYLSRWSSLVG